MTGAGGRFAVTRVVARGALTSADPYSLVTRMRPVVPLSGSGSNTINAGGVGGVGCAMRLGPQPASVTAIATRSADGAALGMRSLHSLVRLRLDPDRPG